ncbi:hypothetical protein QBC38DRAFT_485241 [Podospora fimiseda]|uniref:Kinetochore protein mis14 n=1 Tax=Podospora fimiseda TaxID=252190 RepID=A0AAN7GUD0_9PEZI|nr:hypothetical protein QBC38DRAFT_485241 [Podospora fimiseda]
MADEAAAQRRIELQSPQDLVYLITNVRKAALDSINAAFPPVAAEDDDSPEEDELRNQIEKLVNDYITQTFTLALPSLTINGLPLTTLPTTPDANSSSSSNPDPEPEIQYTPFDPRKRDKIESLVSQEEDLLRSIASLKRKVPSSVAKTYLTQTNQGIENDDEFIESLITKKIRIEGQENGKKVLEGMGPLERQEDVERTFKEGVEGLGKLKKNLPSVVAKMERAKGAGGYVLRGKKK